MASAFLERTERARDGLYRRRRRARAMALFHRDRIRRRRDTRGLGAGSSGPAVQQLRSDGYAVLDAHVDPARLAHVRHLLENALDNGSDVLLPVIVDAARADDGRTSAGEPAPADLVAQGQDAFRSITQAAAIAQPLCVDSAVVDLVFDERLIDIAAGYLGALPAITGVNLRKSYVNDLPPFDTLYFHRDGNSPKFVKFFFYLHDVGPGGGAFTYVPGSHRRRREQVSRKRWTDAEVAECYPVGPVELTAPAGSVIAADTTGFHRGTKPAGADRSMLTVYYAIHPEFGGGGRPFDLPRREFERLSPKQRRAADFLRIVD